ncbi:MAG: hypothetical protein LBB77_03400, partial [Treponema sp.]|nr:hypothetical protein [Treponema sp.]
MTGQGPFIGRSMAGSRTEKGASVPLSVNPRAGKSMAGQAPAAVKAGDSPGGNPAAIRITSLLASLKLPRGELSASILSFAKFFSLPLDGPFLGKVRQRALAGQNAGEAPSLPGKGKAGGAAPASGLHFREALALAALASASKGLELSPRALAAYARAHLHGSVFREDGEETPAEKVENSEGQGTEGRYAGVEGPEDRGSGGRGEAFGGKDPDSGENGLPGKKVPGKDGPASIQKLALAAQGPLLSVLNQLPGKDGKRWIVLPFSLEKLDICLRILLDGSRVCLMG